jgi:hypothetical protein
MPPRNIALYVLCRGDDIMTTDIELTAAAQRRAVEAIELMHQMWAEPGGLAAAEAEVETKRAGASAHIYGLAKWAAKQTDTLPKACELFAALCKHAERQMSEKLAADNKTLTEALPIWRVFKSYINRAMRAGLSPLEYATERALRRACSEKLGVVSRKRPEPVIRETVQAWLDKTTIDEQLRDPLQSLILHAQYARKGKTKAAAAVLAKAIKALDALADMRKLEVAMDNHESIAA